MSKLVQLRSEAYTRILSGMRDAIEALEGLAEGGDHTGFIRGLVATEDNCRQSSHLLSQMRAAELLTLAKSRGVPMPQTEAEAIDMVRTLETCLGDTASRGRL